MKPYLIFCCLASALSACTTAHPAPVVTATSSMTIRPSATPTRTPTVTATLWPTLTPTFTHTSTSTAIPAPIYPAETFAGWKTIRYPGITFKLPPAYTMESPPSPRPLLWIANSPTALAKWTAGDASAEETLFLDVITFELDRNEIPYSDLGPQVSVEAALQREVNQAVGRSFTVAGNTQVPWENANGGMADGSKVWVEHVPYQNVMVGTSRAARVATDTGILYWILYPTGDRYLRIVIQPPHSTLLEMANEILSTITFTP